MSAPRTASGIRILVVIAALIIIIAGLKAAAAIVVPFLLAVFVVILVAPWYFWMQRKGVPSALSLLVIVAALLALGIFGASFFTATVNSFVRNLPQYQTILTQQVSEATGWLEARGVEVPEDAFNQALDTQKLFAYARTIAGSVTILLSNGFVITLVAIFILLEAARLPGKIRNLPGMTDRRWDDFLGIVGNVRQYMAMKTVMSLLTAVLVGSMLWLLDVDYPILLAVLAFLLNFVPSIGSIIAAIPGILLALILQGLGDATICAIGYIIINVGVSNFLEPKYMGKGLGISPMIIIVSLFLWGWILGPVGMLLSVPLTMTIKVALESNPRTRSIAFLLSDGVPMQDEQQEKAGR
ncbi:AI-2E family transporter [Rubellicoccus peritrichatus]|uniref:AI-2E family transporter n=1 Tax=Rubellicoccus peritrichatus TaxID=3080537 RepID=A0AAQ3LEZ2_9BACT|nr:AI-2E family transporter [Puniceicoccus sp. CR14]WOO42433.1 AI-2E family transporter [Puniceicoccus sp. CR14]